MSANDLLVRCLGKKIDGGCLDCCAYQTVRRDTYGWRVTVHHDDTCPAWKAMRA
jgi:hypothetical protein